MFDVPWSCPCTVTSKRQCACWQVTARAASPSVAAVAGPFPPGEVQWVSESRLPLWLIKGYEENARRAALVAAAEAAREAAKGTAWHMVHVRRLTMSLCFPALTSMHSGSAFAQLLSTLPSALLKLIDTASAGLASA